MINKIKQAFSTRKVTSKLPSIKEIHEVTPEELKELQACFLEILKDIIQVCEENDICYMAAGGTCLGSIRHKGFIPWDDDVDLIMPRADLNKFVEIFDRTMGEKYELTSPNSKYQLESMITAVYKKNTLKASFYDYNTPFPKGVHIDIFAIEAVPENRIIRRFKGIFAIGLQFIAVSALFYRFRSDVKKKFFYQSGAGKFNYRLRCTIGFLFSFRPYQVWGNIFDCFVRGNEASKLWAVPTDIGHYFGHVMPKEVYFPPTKGEFEDIFINLPANPDAYLKNQYGDYMAIPPEADREKHYSVGFSLDLKADGLDKDGKPLEKKKI